MGFDIREYKRGLRERFKEIRAGMSAEDKALRDSSIFSRIVRSDAYAGCDTVLTYVSTAIEVDTLALIERAVNDGKKVAVPKCINGTRLMEFYFISSLSDLEKGAFSVLEPIEKKCVRAYGFEDALCVVPGLSFDMEGYRLGYGKGYYDRFLAAHPDLYKMGLCYCPCTVQKLVSGRYDAPVNALVTEKYIKITAERTKGDNNG